jgi:hypothetical protein
MDLVLFECGNSAARRPYRQRVNALSDMLQSHASSNDIHDVLAGS